MALLKIMYNVDSLLGINNDTLLLAKIFTFSISISTFNWSSWRKKTGPEPLQKKRPNPPKLCSSCILKSELRWEYAEMQKSKNAEIEK